MRKQLKRILPQTTNYDIQIGVRDLETSQLQVPSYRRHVRPIEQHSTGGFRGVDGLLWDVFNLSPIDFSAKGNSTEEIIFDKERYLHFSNILEPQFAAKWELPLSANYANKEEMAMKGNSSIESLFTWVLPKCNRGAGVRTERSLLHP